MVLKKILIALLVIVMGLQLCACAAEPTEPTTEEKTVTVGLCLRQQADAPEYYDAIVAALKNAGYGVIVEDSKNDQSRQDQQLRGLLATGCEMLVVEPVMVTALESVVEQAKKSEVPLLLIDREPDAAILASYQELYYVGCQSAEAGTAQAGILEHMNLKGDLNEDGVVSYMMLRGPEDHMDAQLISEGCNLALTKYETDLICTVTTQWDTETARADCAQGLSQFGRDIEVIFCNHALLAAGAVQAVENRGWMPGQDIYIVAVDSNAALQALIQKGAVFGTVSAQSQKRAQVITQTVSSVLLGEKPEKCTYVPYELVTAQP